MALGGGHPLGVGDCQLQGGDSGLEGDEDVQSDSTGLVLPCCVHMVFCSRDVDGLLFGVGAVLPAPRCSCEDGWRLSTRL